MPINPNTRYYVEAQTLQIAYNKCTDMMQKCVSSMKRILISSIITGVLTMIIWIASIIIVDSLSIMQSFSLHSF